MSKVTYHEFRPGHWVKLVDGKIVGRATAEEVAAWKRERMEQTAIWQDVVRQTAPAEPDVEAPPEASLRKPQAGWTEPAEIWQDVLSQVSAAETQSTPRGATKAKPAIKVKPEDVTKAAPAKQLVEQKVIAKATPARQATTAKPSPLPKAAPVKEKARAASPQPAIETEPKATPPKKESSVKAAPTRRAVKSRRTSSVEAVPELAMKAKPEDTAKTTPAEKEITVKPVSLKPTGKAKPRRTATAALSKQAVKEAAADDLLIQLTRKVEAEPATGVMLAKEVAKPKRVLSAAPRRTTAKVSSAKSAERPLQLYLWIMAGLSEDLATAVRSGLARYQERFNHPAEIVLCHIDDVQTLEKADLPVDVRHGKGVPPRNFWIGLK